QQRLSITPKPESPESVNAHTGLRWARDAYRRRHEADARRSRVSRAGRLSEPEYVRLVWSRGGPVKTCSNSLFGGRRAGTRVPRPERFDGQFPLLLRRAGRSSGAGESRITVSPMRGPTRVASGIGCIAQAGGSLPRALPRGANSRSNPPGVHTIRKRAG